MTKSKRARRKISGFQKTLDECVKEYESEKEKRLERLRREIRELIGVET